MKNQYSRTIFQERQKGTVCDSQTYYASQGRILRDLNSMYFLFLFCFSLSFSLSFYCFSSTVVSIMPPLLPTTPATPTFHTLIYPPLTLDMAPLYKFLDKFLDLSLLLSPLTSPLVTISLLFISVSLVIFCLLVCFVH